MSQSLTQAAWLRLRKRPSALLGLAVVVGFILLALFAPFISPQDPIATSWSAIRKDRKSIRLNSSHSQQFRMPSSA